MTNSSQQQLRTFTTLTEADIVKLALDSIDIRKRSSSLSSFNSSTSVDCSTDEGIEMDESPPSSLRSLGKEKQKTNQRIIFICLWPGCGLTYSVCRDVESHVRRIHLRQQDRRLKHKKINRRKEESNGKYSNDESEETGEEEDDEEDDHEEEFYYTEIEVDDSSVCSSFGANGSTGGSPISYMFSPSFNTYSSTDSESTSESPVLSPTVYTGTDFIFTNSSSAPTLSHMDMARPPYEDPDYQRSLAKASVTVSTSTKCTSPFIVSSPINIPLNGSTATSNNAAIATTTSTTTTTTTVSKCIQSKSSPTSLIKSSRNHQQQQQNSMPSLMNSIELRPFVPSATSCTSCCNVSSIDCRAPKTANGSKYMRVLNHHNNSNRCKQVSLKMGTSLLQQSHSKTLSTNATGKRSRSESRKCRKVYGMDNRDSWCTQCKWKKACTRFTD